MKKRILSFILVLVMMVTMIPGLDLRASAASKSEIHQKMVQILYNGAGGKMSCDFDGYVNTSGRHEGIDFSLSKGTSIYALISGTVTRVSNSNSLSTLAIYDATNNKTVIYLHGYYSVSSGQAISKGQKIGVESNLGASAAHTHIEVRNGKQTHASKSVGDYTLDNPDPYSYWEKVLNTTPAPAQSYIEVYPKSYDTKIPVYSSAGGEKLSNRYIDGSTDICRILKFDSSSTWCYVSYPSSSEADGWFEAWVPVTTFVPSTKGTKWVTDQAYTLYRRSDKNNTFENIPKGTEVSIVDETGNMKQVAFNLNTTVSRMGWIEVHTHNYSKKVTNPTCTEKGYTTYTCSCGDSYKDNYTNAAGHKTEIKNAKSATCTATGYDGDEVCKTCGKTIKTGKSIPALGHKWNEGELTKDATCTEEGVVTYTCKNDTSHKKTEPYPAKGHTVTRTDEVPATCTKSGLTEGSHCSVCNTVIVEQAATSPLGHKWGSTITVNATCDQEGSRKAICLRCLYAKVETIPPSHSYGPGLSNRITWPATCETEGFTKYTCTKCDFTEKKDIVPALGHKDENSDYVCDTCSKALCTDHPPVTISGKIATCTEAGLTDGSKCEKCGKVLEEQVTIEPFGHTPDDYGIKTIPATCTEEGFTGFACYHCHNIIKSNITMPLGHTDRNNDYVCDNCKTSLCTPHSFVTINGKAATCTEAGLTDGSKCEKCGKVLEEQKVIEALGHNWLEDTFAPGCEFDGWTVHWCTRCNEEYEDNIVPSTGHKWNNGEIIKEPNETTEGTKLFTCTICKETKEESIPVTIHKHSFTATVTAPGCTESGYTEHKCSCGESYKDTYTDALGHSPELKNAKEATCTTNGYTGDEVCKTCGNTINSGEVIKAKGHSFVNGKCSRCGESDPNYEDPKPEEPIVNPFNDVKESDWFYAPVLWAVQNNVTGGTSPNTFGPNNFCTRAQVVTFLWAANGKPEPISMNNPFTDVSDSAWYCKAVMWAVEQGITGGTSATTFSPDAYCTRAQVATFLYAAQGKPAVNNTTNEFIDVPDNAWYLNPVLWAAENGITGGIGGGKFGPDQTCTRAQIATFLYKAMS